MQNKHKFLLFSCSALLGATTLLAATNGGVKLLDRLSVTAAECAHENVAHYGGHISGGSVEVEHWACCACHTAWADEARTIEIGNTMDDRSKINTTTDYDFSVQYHSNGDWNWNGRYVPQYSAEGPMIKAVDLEVVDMLFFCFTAPEELSGNKGFHFIVENNTDTALEYSIVSRSWNVGVSKSWTIEPNTKDTVTSKELNVWNYDALKGVAVRFTPVGQSSFNGSINVSLPYILDDNRSSFIGMIKDDNWHPFSDYADLEHGFGFTKDLSALTSLNLHLEGRVKIDESLYTGVEFLVYNSSDTDTNDGTLWNEGGWDDVIRSKTGVFKAHEWTPVFVPVEVWNYDNNNDYLGIYDLGNSLNGSLTFARFKCVNYVFGFASEEFFTNECTDWTNLPRSFNTQFGYYFDANGILTGKSIATNNGKVLPSNYKGLEFYVYNYTGCDIKMYSTNDWVNTADFGTLKNGEWTKCFIPADVWNNINPEDQSRVKNMFFYPSNDEGIESMNFFITAFSGVPNA